MSLRGGSLSRSLIAAARNSSRPFISPIGRPTSPLRSYLLNSRRPLMAVPSIRGLLGCTESLLPLHSAVADTHLTSHISIESRAYCHLSQGIGWVIVARICIELAEANSLNPQWDPNLIRA